MTVRDIVIVIVFIYVMALYYFWRTSGSAVLRRYAQIEKILMLMLTVILAFFRADSIQVGEVTFGGRMVPMVLAGYEVLDTVLEMRENKK